MYWTEAAIAEELGNKFFQVRTGEGGSIRVVDLNGVEPIPALQVATRWSVDELVKLVLLKRRGFTNFEIGMELDRDPGSVNEKWRMRAAWKDGLDIPRQEILSLSDIARTVCNVFNVKGVDLHSARRRKDVVLARQVYFWIARYYTTFSYPQIGAFVSGKDHSTVIHGVRKIDAQFDAARSNIELCLFDLGLTEKIREAA